MTSPRKAFLKALPCAHRNCLSIYYLTISTWLSPKVKSVLALPDPAEWHLTWQRAPSLLGPCPQPLLSLPHFTIRSLLSSNAVLLHRLLALGRVLPQPPSAAQMLCGLRIRLSIPSLEHSFPQPFPTGRFSFREPMSVKGNSTVAATQPEAEVTTEFLF